MGWLTVLAIGIGVVLAVFLKGAADEKNKTKRLKRLNMTDSAGSRTGITGKRNFPVFPVITPRIARAGRLMILPGMI